MRLRRNYQGEAKLQDMPGVLPAGPASFHCDWAAQFNRKNPIHIEIGMGKGDFLIAMAAKYPRIDFVGIEKGLTVMYIAARKNRVNPLPNLRFLPADAKELDFYFDAEQLERIYLNFSDPWPKKRHESRRLTAVDKLRLYHRLLKPGGQIQMKTDQEDFLQFTLRSLIREGWSVGKITRDLHRSGYEGNVVTEYERRFLRIGQPIYRLEAWKTYAER